MPIKGRESHHYREQATDHTSVRGGGAAANGRNELATRGGPGLSAKLRATKLRQPYQGSNIAGWSIARIRRPHNAQDASSAERTTSETLRLPSAAMQTSRGAAIRPAENYSAALASPSFFSKYARWLRSSVLQSPNKILASASLALPPASSTGNSSCSFRA